jgi:hypothetical protein
MSSRGHRSVVVEAGGSIFSADVVLAQPEPPRDIAQAPMAHIAAQGASDRMIGASPTAVS